MDLLDAMRSFVRVVETGSFSAVARELNATQVLERTTSWFGEGRFVVRGSQLAVWPLKGKPRTSYWYVDEEANSACASGWLRRLHRIQLTYDGKAAYESALVQRQ